MIVVVLQTQKKRCPVIVAVVVCLVIEWLALVVLAALVVRIHFVMVVVTVPLIVV